MAWRVLQSIEEVSKERWNALVPADAPPVSRWEWLYAMEASRSASRETGWQPHHFVFEQDGQLLAAAPAYVKFHSMGEYVYDFAWADAAAQLGIEYYPKLLIGAPLSPMTAPKFLIHASLFGSDTLSNLVNYALQLVEDLGFSSLHILYPTKTEMSALRAMDFIPRATLQFHFQNHGYENYAAFLQRFDAKRRHQLKRERAAAASQGISVRTIRLKNVQPDELSPYSRLAFQFYHATNTRHAWGQLQLNQGFFEKVMELLPDFSELVLAERGGKVVAGAFNLATNTHLYGRYWGCFEDWPFLHFHVCLYHSIDDCVARGIRTFEPGAGGEHKISRGFEPTIVHSAHYIANTKLRHAVAQFCKREYESLQEVESRRDEIVGFKK